MNGQIYYDMYPNPYTEAIASVAEYGKVYKGYPSKFKEPIGYISSKGFIYNKPHPTSDSQPVGQIIPPSYSVGGAALILLFENGL